MKTNIKLRVTPEQSKAVQKICFNNKIYWAATGSNFEEDNVRYIFIDIDVMSLTYESTFFHKHEFEEIDADLFIRTNGTCVEPEETTIEATIEECQFEKYGFEKHEDCVILTKVGSWLIGYVKNVTKAPKPAMWFEYDGSSSISTLPNLQPIKKPWYETCKFPCLVKDEDGTFLISEIGWYSEEYIATLTPLTNDEIEGLKQ